jgi:hypothetical protein
MNIIFMRFETLSEDDVTDEKHPIERQKRKLSIAVDLYKNYFCIAKK